MITIAILAAAIPAIVIACVVAFLRAGISREDSDRSLRTGPATLTSAVTRHVVGLHVRMPQPAVPADEVPGGTNPAASPWPSDSLWPGDPAN